MTVIGPVLFLLGLAVCWLIGRMGMPRDNLLVPAATALFGVAGLMTGFPDLWSTNFLWALLVLTVYGSIGALIARSGKATREQSK